MMTAFFRTIILYILIMLGLRLLGKRQIGQLEPSELVLTMMLSDLATVPMQDFGIPLLAGVIPIVTLLSLSLLISQLSLRSLRLRDAICGTPSVLIREGVVQQKAMAENRYTLDELLEALRVQGYADLTAVRFAVLETSGQLSLLPWKRSQPLTPSDLGLEEKEGRGLPTILISDGRVLGKALAQSGHDRPWLEKQLRREGIPSPKAVFLFTVDDTGHTFCIPKEGI